jgi:hypothetical protein
MVAAAASLLSHMKGSRMSLVDLCLILGVLFAFATLVVKIIEVARRG